MNAISFLLKEHDHVRKTFAEIADESHRLETKKNMFQSLGAELIRHETMEQKTWYPKLKENKELALIIQHLVSEEKSAAETIKELDKTKNDEEWAEIFFKLKEDVEHHAAEEESKLFPKVKSFLEEKELEEIGKEMREFKATY
jgi:iron-sulfur cluster repair protein YtfE (RIC family)